MKKTIFLLLPLLSAVACYCQEDDGALQKEVIVDQSCDVMDEYEGVCEPEFANESEDEEIQLAMQEENALQEYEQHVCDMVTIKPPKPYSISAIFTNIGCTVLIYYIFLTEKTKVCLTDLKNRLAKWMCAKS